MTTVVEQWEFDELTNETADRFLPQMPARYMRDFERMLNAGELAMAMDDLVLTLATNNIPATPAALGS